MATMTMLVTDGGLTGAPSDGGWQDGRGDIRNALDGETGLRNDMDTKQVSLFATVFFSREGMRGR